MSDFKFNCKHCNQSLEAPEEMLGQEINCPTCNKEIIIATPHSTLNNEVTAQLAYSPNDQRSYKISPDSPAGAIDEKLFPFLSDMALILDEEIYFLRKTNTPAMDLPGFLKPMYNLMVSDRSVHAIAKNKAGNASYHRLTLDKNVSASIKKGLLTDTIVFSDGDDRQLIYDFVNRDPLFKREYLPSIVEHIKKCIVDLYAEIESENRREEELREEQDKKRILAEKQRKNQEMERTRAQEELRNLEKASIARFLDDPIADSTMDEETWKFFALKSAEMKLLEKPTIPEAVKVTKLLRTKLAIEVRRALYQHHMRINAQQLQPALVMNCFLYCFAKGVEAAYLWKRDGCTRWGLERHELKLSYVPDDAIGGYDRTKAEALTPLCTDEILASAASVFSAFFENISSCLKSQSETTKLLEEKSGRRQAGFVFFGLFWSSIIGLAFGFEKLGMDTEQPSDGEKKIRYEAYSDEQKKLLKEMFGVEA